MGKILFFCKFPILIYVDQKAFKLNTYQPEVFASDSIPTNHLTLLKIKSLPTQNNPNRIFEPNYSRPAHFSNTPPQSNFMRAVGSFVQNLLWRSLCTGQAFQECAPSSASSLSLSLYIYTYIYIYIYA